MCPRLSRRCGVLLRPGESIRLLLSEGRLPPATNTHLPYTFKHESNQVRETQDVIPDKFID